MTNDGVGAQSELWGTNLRVWLLAWNHYIERVYVQQPCKVLCFLLHLTLLSNVLLLLVQVCLFVKQSL
jgi:hypothetical protein